MCNTNKEKLVSVIIPVYNVEKYIKRCLESVINQTHKNLEIILVDDGSTDQSGKICDDFAVLDKRIKVIHTRNNGISAARNTALQVVNSGGGYILFLDSDDYLDLDVIEKCLLEDRDLVMFPYIREYPEYSKTTKLFNEEKVLFGKDGEQDINVLRKRFVGLTGEQLKYPQRLESLSPVCIKLYKREIALSTVFTDEKIVRSEDLLFNIECMFNVKTASYISNTHYHYNRGNKSSFTKGFDLNIVNQWKNLYIRINEVLKENNASEDFYKALSNRRALSLISLTLRISNIENEKLKTKLKYIKYILKDKDYAQSIKGLKLKHMPIHFKAFYICAKMKWVFGLFVFGRLMNKFRKSA